MATYAATAAFTFGTEIELSLEDLTPTPMHVNLVEVREPIWIELIEVSN